MTRYQVTVTSVIEIDLEAWEAVAVLEEVVDTAGVLDDNELIDTAFSHFDVEDNIYRWERDELRAVSSTRTVEVFS